MTSNSSKLIDADQILSCNEQWVKLDQDWKAIDLETEEDNRLSPVLSTLDLRKTTFDSSFYLKKIRKKVGRKLSQISKQSTPSDLDYSDFLEDLEDDEVNNTSELPLKQFSFISGQIISALSIEEICDRIDDIFQSIERLCSATSTLRLKKKTVKPIPEVVYCSISTTGLSFDDTTDSEREKNDEDDVERYIDEAFEHLNSTVASLAAMESTTSEEEGTVTALVKKFSTYFNNPGVRSPRKRRHCSDKFRELAEFWKKRTMDNN